MKSGTFSKRSGAATKGFEPCEFWFQVAFFFNLNTALYFLGQYVCMEENNLKISLALYIRLAFSLITERYLSKVKRQMQSCIAILVINNKDTEKKLR